MDDSFESNDLLTGVVTARDSNGFTMNLPHGYINATLSDHSHCAEKGPPPRTHDLTRPPITATAKTKNKKQKQKQKHGMYNSCLAQVVSGVFRSVVANYTKPAVV